MRGDPDHPANFGRLCTKGSHAAPDGAPRRSRGRRGCCSRCGARTAASSAAARRRGTTRWTSPPSSFAQVIREHGPDAVGFYVSGQLLTEDYYVFNKLAKGLIGTNNIDTNSRLCMSSAVAGYKMTLGADAPPACYDDVDHAAVHLHRRQQHGLGAPDPVPPHRGRQGRQPADEDHRLPTRAAPTPPRSPTCTCRIQPGTDVMLFHGMLHIMLWEGWIDSDYIAAHTSGFDALKATVRDCTPDLVAQVCGITKEDLFTRGALVRHFGRHA